MKMISSFKNRLNWQGGANVNIEELKQRIFESGVVGAGGAGFPTNVKLNENADTIILNCAECEPLLRVDQQLMAIYTDEIISALSLIVETLKANVGIIAIKAKYKEALEAINNRISQYPFIKLHLLPDIYPSGDEVMMIYEATGKVVPRGSIPIVVGAIVLNTETVLNIYNAIIKQQPVTKKYVTITGEVNSPITVCVPIGTKIKELIKMAGGQRVDEIGIVMGGPMTGILVDEDTPITKTTKAILVLPKKHTIIQRKQATTVLNIKKVMSVCSQCRMCTDLCPRNLLGHNVEPHRLMNALANGLTIDSSAFLTALGCCSCGICEMFACHHELSPRSLMMDCKAKLMAKGLKQTVSENSRVNPQRDIRAVQTKRLIARLNLTQYNNIKAPISKKEIFVDSVEIPLKQHVGVPSISNVEEQQLVHAGDVIATVPDAALGAVIHASIDGKVEKVTQNSITIRARGGRE
jgi:Na+-translocating ferredoxin:NAD+ oxidoreductase RnfC subunit